MYCASEIWWLSQLGTYFAGPRGSVFCLGAAFLFSPPPGERCGRGWPQRGGGPSGDAFWRGLEGKRPRCWCTNRAYCLLPGAVAPRMAQCRRPWLSARAPAPRCRKARRPACTVHCALAALVIDAVGGKSKLTHSLGSVRLCILRWHTTRADFVRVQPGMAAGSKEWRLMCLP
jgi:hypothetical protein